MAICEDCGGHTNTSYGNSHLCRDCIKKRKQNEVIEKSRSLTSCSDFAKWDSGDMSELFWIHLGRYVKEPNPESYKFIDMAFRWACHDNHGLANSFSNAMKWVGFDPYTEYLRWRAKK